MTSNEKITDFRSYEEQEAERNAMMKLCRADFIAYVETAIHQDLRQRYLAQDSYEWRMWHPGWMAAYLRFIKNEPWAHQ
jgi:hypothetical protein